MILTLMVFIHVKCVQNMNSAFENQDGGKTLKRLFDTYRILD